MGLAVISCKEGLEGELRKIALVAVFLGILISVQTYLYFRRKDKDSSKFPNHGLRVISRLKLAKNTDLDVVSTGAESFLIISNKNTQPTVVQLSQNISEQGSLMRESQSE